MTSLPIAALVGLGLLFFATPLIVLVLVLLILSLRSRVHRLEARLADLEHRVGQTPVTARDDTWTGGPLVRPSPRSPPCRARPSGARLVD